MENLKPYPSDDQAYWEFRARDGKIYGDEPSSGARLALPYLSSGSTLLEIGGAYGRNCFLFARRGIDTTNVDLCANWISIAEQTKGPLPLQNICSDILEFSPSRAFDVIFSNFVLHFFSDEKLDTIFQQAHSWLKAGGLFINSWLSTNDPYATEGYPVRGYQITPKCFTKPEFEVIHRKHEFQLIACNELRELESINSKDRKTTFWFTVAKKV